MKDANLLLVFVVFSVLVLWTLSVAGEAAALGAAAAQVAVLAVESTYASRR